MSRLTDLIAKAKAKDSALGAELDREFKILSSRLPFGLNFERHSPEAVELPLRPIRKGDKVRVLPERGTTRKGDQRLWQVRAIHKAKKSADLELLDAAEVEMQTVALDDLVVVAEFRDTIYPGLVSTGKVRRGGDKPCHTVINGENYHVLKALTYTHRGKVDAIYIDPPYNSGAKDWKYNNDYVERDDLYRHSKWLAMMERRLLVAKELLNPLDSLLIVTIDEKEYLRLGLLLEQVFPEGRSQMISTVINRKGNARRGEFSRSEEFIYFLRFGDAEISPWRSDMLNQVDDVNNEKIRWKSLLRLASTGQTSGRFNMFYPLFFDAQTLKFLYAGDPIADGVPIESVQVPAGTTVLWPMQKNGKDGRWSLSQPKFNDYLKRGYVKFGTRNGGGRTPYYLMEGQIAAIESGDLVVTGTDADGSVELKKVASQRSPLTIWNQASHSTSGHGTALVKDLLAGRTFPYPKSLYAVEDALRFVVSSKPEAIVLDFFSGSGTTAHAVMRLNRQDGGRRQCISVTNNEVAANEQKKLREQGLRPGDDEWEKWGICDHITKPRVAAAITGRTPGGEPIKGDYKFTDEFPMAEGFEENAEFFTLTYETPVSVNYNLAFNRIAPLLWLRAGARGSRIDRLPGDGWAVADAYGLLSNVDAATPFIKALAKAAEIRIAYIVTDDDRRFQAIAKRLPDGVEPVRLYESYLTNFSFTNGE
ncbi:TPA: site-specific DNA-methyltransferase [Citrobacter freundii]|nr:site-specific DNA-methyltransferase [Citrobacter freundii]HED3519364.1 site-specific DNA-methyltransferase [Citrobacter freundii]HED3524583.1 site-specific DNA-methyltransferase [Citrobacter freundii]HED3593044.1 site-specific DNA-methyltransferase [Citrobacter freundii]